MKEAACVMWASMIKAETLSNIKNIRNHSEDYVFYANTTYEDLGIEEPTYFYGIQSTIESKLAKSIIFALKHNTYTIDYYGEEYNLLRVFVFAPQFLGLDKRNYSFALLSKKYMEPIYVCKKIRCIEQNHRTEDVIAHVERKKQKIIYRFNVVFCFTCGKYFTTSNTVREFQRSQTNLNVLLLLYSSSYGDMDFAEQSWLTVYGYKVGKSGLDAKSRHSILKYIIDNGIMSRYEIIQLLESNITLREIQYDKDFSYAISDWEEDIKFIKTYFTDEQRTIEGELIFK